MPSDPTTSTLIYILLATLAASLLARLLIRVLTPGRAARWQRRENRRLEFLANRRANRDLDIYLRERAK
jgi:hypothetical protein